MVRSVLVGKVSSLATRARPAPWLWPLVVLCAVVAVGTVVTVGAASGPYPYDALGNTDPGILVHIGAPVLRLACDVSGSLCVGLLAYAAFFAGSKRSGSLTAQGYLAVRRAGWWATAWCVAAVVLLPFDMADTGGVGLSAMFTPSGFLGMMGALEEPKAWLATVILALLVAVGCRIALGWRSSVGLLAVAILGLLPPLCTGHASSDTAHDVATAAVLVHVPTAALWLGLLAALLQPALRVRVFPLLRRRYSRVATTCWLILVVSGLVLAVILVPSATLATSAYGVLLLVKIVLVAALGTLGWFLRRQALRSLENDGGARRWARLAAGELAVLTTTVAVSVGLTHLPPPAFIGQTVTPLQTLLGYNLAGPPTLARLALDWRFDVLFGTLAILMAAGYLMGLRRLARRGERWPPGRTAAWLAGCLVILVATSSGIGRYEAAMFSIHMASHMLLSMVAPLLLVLGGPGTLALRSLRAAGQGEPAGPREWVRTLGASPAVRSLTHPLTALVVFCGSPFLLYFSGLFDLAARFHWAHLGIDGYFLVVGYLFAWPVLGADPLPRPLPNLVKLGMLVAAMPFDTVFAAILMTTRRVVGNGVLGDNMYGSLALPWVPNLLADQWIGGVLALGLGEFALLAAGAVLLVRWFSTEEKEQVDEEMLITRLAQRSRQV
jgi:putative copper resistance protein D